MINMIAVVGRGGVIGPKNALPNFADPEVKAVLAHRAQMMTEDSVLVFGSNTAQMMADSGVRLDLTGGSSYHAIWSRSRDLTPAEFLTNLSASGKKIFITGGRTTFRIFAPFCWNFFIWRAELLGDDQNVMDPILPNWTHKQVVPQVVPVTRVLQ